MGLEGISGRLVGLQTQTLVMAGADFKVRSSCSRLYPVVSKDKDPTYHPLWPISSI